MNQQLHNWYLSVLGITQYIPRESASVLAASQSPAIKVEADTSVEPGDQQAYSKRKPGPRITIDLNTSETEKPAAPVTVTDSSAITQATPAARFRLACWQPSDDLLVIDSLEPGEQPGAERTQLLVNILRSIKRMPDTIAQAELIDWPVALAMGVGSALVSRHLSDLEAREDELAEAIEPTADDTPKPATATATARKAPAKKAPAKKATAPAAAKKAPQKTAQKTVREAVKKTPQKNAKKAAEKAPAPEPTAAAPADAAPTDAAPEKPVQ